MSAIKDMEDVEHIHPAVKRLRLSDHYIVSPGILPHRTRHRPPRLPNELWHKIFDMLPVSDIKVVRATWKLWAAIGERHLFPLFRFSLGRKDFERFRQVGGRGDFLKGIKELYLETGKAGIFCISSALAVIYYNQQMQHGRQHSSEIELTKALAEYAEWNIVAHENNNSFRDVELLLDTFRPVNALDSIQITRRSLQIQNPLLFQAWDLCRHSDYFERANSEFGALLFTLNISDIRLKHLSHDQLPVTFFRRDFETIKKIIEPLVRIRCLHLTFDATTPPRKVFWENLGKTLQFLPLLADLRFGFLPICDMSQKGRSWQNYDDDTPWYVPLWKILGTSTWTNLESLRLDGMVFCEAGLLEVLERHAPTLKSLELSSICLRYGCFRRFFVWLQSLMKLTTFKIWGHLKASQYVQQKWRLRPTAVPCDKAWNQLTREWYEELFLIPTRDGTYQNPPYFVRENLEAFVMNHGTWPVFFPQSVPKLDSKGYSADVSNKATISREWDGLPDGKDDIMWELGLEDDVDIHGNEILEIYHEDGYDDFGFDVDGYDENGLFHTDPLFLAANGNSKVSAATAKRRILRRIKDKIPRLDDVKIGI